MVHSAVPLKSERDHIQSKKLIDMKCFFQCKKCEILQLLEARLDCMWTNQKTQTIRLHYTTFCD